MNDCTVFSPDYFINELYNYAYASPYRNVTSAEEAFIIAAGIKSKLAEIFALDKIPGKCASEITYINRDENRGAYTQSRLSVKICENLNMLCYVLMPNSAPNGFGVTALCGHGYGARQIINQGKNEKKRLIPFLDSYQKNFAIELVKNGCTVIVPELIGFGEARLERDIRKPFYASSCATLSSRLLPYGLTTASIRIFQAMCCTDILISELGISADKIGCMGISGGGLTALYTAVLDDRISRCVVSGYVNSFKDSIMSVWHCPDNYFPNVLNVGEIYDFACALAPRKLLIECGEKDKLFPAEGSHKAAREIERVYTLCGAHNCFSADFFDGKHQISGTKSFTFFNGD